MCINSIIYIYICIYILKFLSGFYCLGSNFQVLKTINIRGIEVLHDTDLNDQNNPFQENDDKVKGSYNNL